MAASAVDALEDGRVLYCPRLGFELSREEEKFLSSEIADQTAKNVSLDPATNRLKHAHGSPADIDAIATMMRRYRDHATSLMRVLLAHYGDAFEIGRTSLRPAEIQGRALSPRKDDTRLHVDAFPSTPTGGRRILRIFTNVNPDGKGRRWRFGAPFEEVARTFARSVRKQSSAGAWAMNIIGATKSYRTAYDHFMLSIHDKMKADELYQRSVVQNEFSFPPGSTWIAYTDKVSHAATGGQHLLEQTFYLPVSAMADASKAPLRILERVAGRALV